MSVLIQLAGAALLLAALADVFLTVLYARSGTSLLSERLGRWTWAAFRWACKLLPRRPDWLLSLCGPAILVLIVASWASSLLIGFALIVWPALGSGIRATSMATPTDFATAIYVAGGTMSTAGSGDLMPRTAALRLLIPFQAIVGICVLTLTITYFLEVYTGFMRRNTFALALHHATRGTGDAAELVAGLGPDADFSAAGNELARFADAMINLYESHHFYPSLLYFRFPEAHCALARVALVALDGASIIRAALDETRPAVARSSQLRQLWGVGIEMVSELSHVHLPRPEHAPGKPPDQQTSERWRRRYRAAGDRLRRAGIETADDAVAAHEYVSLRAQWDAYVFAFGRYMDHTPEEIDPAAAGAAVASSEPAVV